MSLLPKGGRSDSSLNVHGCAIALFSQDGAASAAFHIRLPGSTGTKMLAMLQQLISSPKFQTDVKAKGRMTVDDSSIGIAVAVHCMVTAGGLVLLAPTRHDYPTRVVFPSSSIGSGLLARIEEVADDELGTDAFLAGGRGAAGTVRRVTLGERVSMALERVCADYEDKGAHDSVLRVQGEVDDAMNVMHGNLQSLMANQEQLTSLAGKSDAIAGASKGFYREARTTRRQMQCEEFRNRLLLAALGVGLFLLLFGGWLFGSDDEAAPPLLHIPPPPSPPPE